jgi:3-hydroxy-9,10-secoandrosta-1,3,5(10)-triene-9,17-dione monooxygenase reductase component
VAVSEDPFATPRELRAPARRLRGRLVAPVTVWTSGGEMPSGLTVSSMLVAEGDPSSVMGLLNETTAVWDAMGETGTVVVHVLERRHRRLAERFAGAVPSPGGVFAGLAVAPSPWGPVLAEVPTRAYCRVVERVAAGYQQLARATIESLDLPAAGEPLAHFHGRYRELAPERL